MHLYEQNIYRKQHFSERETIYFIKSLIEYDMI
jgi:hypothetical protein